ncbi:hypothetical protein T11_564 [Trichinella zimbabwensis]|uniref:FLYWCH-type domain-containing protein n=1 Tax=Trichinella zimbabwensis TaxID=268475 RepID=A0A0V1GPU7_9BILA|nr:hypothetical protein T11_564 [Trichinella zimbabwensis]
MADISELRLVPNPGCSMYLDFKGKAYKLKPTGKQKKYWRCSKLRGAVWTDLEMTAVINRKDHVETCRVDEHLTYKMEKKALLKKRSAEEIKPLPTIYDEEASAASAEFSTSGQFPVYKRVRATTYKSQAKRFLRLPEHRHDLSVPQWYQQLFTIYVFVAGNLVPGILKRPDTTICGYFPNTILQGCYFYFCQAVHRKVATAFLPVPQVHTGVILLEAGIRDTLSVFIPIFFAEVGDR